MDVATKCRREGCANTAKRGGVCVAHGARKKRCSHEVCANGVVAGGVCITHGARTQLCKSEGRAKRTQKGGLCPGHSPYSIVAQNGAARPPHPAGGYDARANVASAIAGGGGKKIESDTHNLQADVSCAAAPGSPSLRHSIMALNFSDDDEDTIGAWIWRSSCMAKLGSANKTDVVLCVVMAQ